MAKNKYYAVKRGQKPGIYQDWNEVQSLVSGYPDASFKGFKTEAEAREFMQASDKSKNENQNLSTDPSQIDLNKYDAIIYTDGGCRNTGNVKGGHVKSDDLSAWAYELKTKKGSVTGTKAYRGFTNNQMEITAGIWALRDLKHQHAENKKILFVSDSHYVLDSVTQKRLQKWESNNWKTGSNTEVKNKEYWKQFAKLAKDFPNMDYQWVKGHSNTIGNNKVDGLLNESMDNLAHNPNYSGDRTLTLNNKTIHINQVDIIKDKSGKPANRIDFTFDGDSKAQHYQQVLDNSSFDKLKDARDGMHIYDQDGNSQSPQFKNFIVHGPIVKSSIDTKVDTDNLTIHESQVYVPKENSKRSVDAVSSNFVSISNSVTDEMSMQRPVEVQKIQSNEIPSNKLNNFNQKPQVKSAKIQEVPNNKKTKSQKQKENDDFDLDL